MKMRASAILAAAVLVCVTAGTGLAQTPYSQDFEALTPVNGSLAADGWLNFGNVFYLDGSYWYGYGPYPAVNNIGNWQDIVSGQGGPEQGLQQLVVYSDYQNGNHPNAWIETNLYREWTLPAGATGTWIFTFDAKMGNLAGNSTALAFIKTLDPNAGWIMTNFITADMTYTPLTWTGYSLSIDIAGLGGQILQIGFLTKSTNYQGSGIFYDNVNFFEAVSAVEETTWGAVKALYR